MMPAQLFQPTLPEMLDEVERELVWRRQVYPRQIEAKRLTQAKADRKIEIMEAIANKLAGELKVVRQRQETRRA